MTKTKNIVGLIVLCVLLCELAGLVGSLFTFAAIPTWYAGLHKPFFTPPAMVFGPAWTLLYALMGLSLALIIRNGLKNKMVMNAVQWFGVQLIFNVLWSVLFFGLKLPLIAFVEIIIMWLAICITAKKFFVLNNLAGIILTPYVVWVVFASALNVGIVILN